MPPAPRPTVVAAVPRAVGVLTDFAGAPDVVGDDAAVLGRPLPPRAEVVGHPLAVAFLSGVEVGVRHQARDVEVQRDVALRAALVQHLEQALFVRRVEEVCGLVELQVPPREAVSGPAVVRAVGVVFVGGEVAELRAHAPVHRPANHPLVGVVVPRLRVGGVELHELLRPVDDRLVVGRGEAHVVRVEVALPEVEPVAALFELVDDHRVAERRLRLRAAFERGLVHAAGVVKQAFLAAHRVHERPVVESLDHVVEAVDAHVVVRRPERLSVGSGVVGDEPVDRVGGQVEQRSLFVRPRRRPSRLGGRFELAHANIPRVSGDEYLGRARYW